jgi:hypothetical protein
MASSRKNPLDHTVDYASFIKSHFARKQLTLRRYVVQIWSRTTDIGGPETFVVHRVERVYLISDPHPCHQEITRKYIVYYRLTNPGRIGSTET